MPPPSTTGRAPLTPNPTTIAIDSLQRTFSPISATNLFPDETPDTDRISSTTESAHFSDIAEDDPSPHDDDFIPQIDHEMPTNIMEVHRESPHPSPAHNHDHEPPSMDDDAPVINVTDTTEFRQDVDTDPSPAMIVPPTAEHISSLLLHTRRRAADDVASLFSPDVTGSTADGATATAASQEFDRGAERTVMLKGCYGRCEN